MWVLFLNDMRSSNIENLQPVCRAETRSALDALLQREAVPGYRDGQWGKSFRQGGPLEWFNPPWSGDERQHFQDAGTEADWAANAVRAYQQRVMSLPTL